MRQFLQSPCAFRTELTHSAALFLHIFTSDTKESFSSHARSRVGSGEGDIYEKLVTEFQRHRALYDPGSKNYHDSALKDNLWQSIATGLYIEVHLHYILYF